MTTWDFTISDFLDLLSDFLRGGAPFSKDFNSSWYLCVTSSSWSSFSWWFSVQSGSKLSANAPAWFLVVELTEVVVLTSVEVFAHLFVCGLLLGCPCVLWLLGRGLLICLLLPLALAIFLFHFGYLLIRSPSNIVYLLFGMSISRVLSTRKTKLVCRRQNLLLYPLDQSLAVLHVSVVWWCPSWLKWLWLFCFCRSYRLRTHIARSLLVLIASLLADFPSSFLGDRVLSVFHSGILNDTGFLCWCANIFLLLGSQLLDFWHHWT